VTGEAEKPPIFTIGYGSRELDEVVALLKRYDIEFVGDVRSAPYSKHRPEFSRRQLEPALRGHGLRYVFLGDVLGGRPDDPSCYDVDGHVDYERCRLNASFARGIERVVDAYRQGHRLALLCSEGRPEECHRSKLLAEMLAERGVPVVHIDEKGALLAHEEVASNLRGPQLTLVADGLGRSRRAYRAA
jgi:uncharacterized protein (DUF488 family)